jgi:glutamyl-tRNA reductase
MLHTPTVRLREAGEASDDEFIATARKLFGLEPDDPQDDDAP